MNLTGTLYKKGIAPTTFGLGLHDPKGPLGSRAKMNFCESFEGWFPSLGRGPGPVIRFH